MYITQHDKPANIDTAALTFTVTIEQDEMPAFQRMKKKLFVQSNETLVEYFFRSVFDDVKAHQLEAIDFAVEKGLSLERATLFADYIAELGWTMANQPYMTTWADRFLNHTEWERSDHTGRAILRQLAPDKY